MHTSPNAASLQRRVQRHIENTDAYGFFNLLTGPEFLDEVESLLPEHRERLFPPTETLSMFTAQALSNQWGQESMGSESTGSDSIE